MSFARLLQGLLLLGLALSAPLSRADVRLPVELVDAHSVPVELSDGSVSEQLIYLALTVRGRLYELALEPSEVVQGASLVMFDGGPADTIAPAYYQGQVLGAADSWVRLSWLEGRPSGLIRVGGQLLAIDYDPVFDELLARDQASERDPARGAGQLLDAGLVVAAPVQERVLPLSIVIDTRYNEAFSGAGLERALTVVNAADGLYQEQLGLRLQLRTARLMIDPGRDPMRRLQGSIDELLSVFRQYRLGDVALERGLGAVHLFSGVDLVDKRVGLAYINTICRSDGYDVGVSRVVDRDIFTFAHELAHNIGAEHDVDTRCGDAGQLMNATLSSGTSYAFSACSVASLQRGLQRSCVRAAPSFQFAAAGLEGGQSESEE